MSAPPSAPSAPAAAAAQVAGLATTVGEKLGLAPAAAPAAPAKKDVPKDKAPKAPKAKKDKKKGNDLPEAQPIHPSYLDKRIELFEKAKAERDAFVAAQPRNEIVVTLPDGSSRVGTAWVTSPMDIAKQISKSLSEKIVIAKVDGQLWDLERPLEGPAALELLDFDHPEGKRVFWHSSAHVLGEACELLYGCHLCIGPPTDDGFFYEMAMGDSAADGRVARQEDFPALEKLTAKAIKEKQPFERVVLPKEKLLELFEYNKYKQHIIKDKIPDGTSTTVYRCGPMIDLCVGPHIPHTGRIKALSVLKNSASYFLGDQNNDSLQRLYGISFPDNARMKEYKKWLEEAAKRDHRKIGKEQELFFFHDLSPGSAFWLPHGARIYEKLMTLMKNEYHKRGFTEVGTPNMFNSKLWETSGHWANYKDDMFTLPVEKDTFALKPMNCPGHCLVYAHRDRSYRELPLRLAEFGVIHRNEASGALSGLTRVRRFVQDDAHIFCMASQIEDEMANCFTFLENVYGKFGFSFKLGLSTRPEKKFIGELAVWNAAEARLKSALDKFVPGKWVVNEGDGAFYGPKIDIEIKDAMGREFQCATIQLDFNLPNRFDLKFRAVPGQGTLDGGNFDRPVMIHRAILGSVERFIAILTEHFAGKWPFWLSPRQVMVVPVSTDNYKYAQAVAELLHEQGKFYADADLTDNTLKKKIFNAEKSQYNFILVVGAREEENKAVNVRANGKEVPHSLDDTLKALTRLAESQEIENVLDI